MPGGQEAGELHDRLWGDPGGGQGAVCIIPAAGLSKPHSFIFTSGEAFLPLSTQNTYNLNPSLAGKQFLTWAERCHSRTDLGSTPYYACGLGSYLSTLSLGFFICEMEMREVPRQCWICWQTCVPST